MAEQEVNEGILLALGAQAEVLSKMNGTLDNLNTYFSTLSKSQEVEVAKAEEQNFAEQVEYERQGLIKAVATEVLQMISKELSTEGAGGENGKAKKLSTDSGSIQDVIQASKDKPNNIPQGNRVTKGEEEDEEGEEKEETKDEEKEDKKFPSEEDFKKSVAAEVTAAVEARFQKMGWKQERSLKAPVRVELGADMGMEIKKGATQEEAIAVMAKYDYPTLVRMQLQAEAEGLPPEMTQLIGGK